MSSAGEEQRPSFPPFQTKRVINGRQTSQTMALGLPAQFLPSSIAPNCFEWEANYHDEFDAPSPLITR